MSIEQAGKESVPPHIIEASVTAACKAHANDIAFDDVLSRAAIVLQEELNMGYRYATAERITRLSGAIIDHISRAMNLVPQDKRHAQALAAESPLIQSLLLTYWQASQRVLFANKDS